MHKISTSLCLAIIIFLSACSGNQAPSQKFPTATPATTVRTTSQPATPITCSTVSLIPTPDASVPSLFPPASAADRSQGSENAAMTLIKYADFQCPACADLSKVFKQLKENYPDEIRIIFRHFPLISIHDKAALAAQASEAAGEQGKFWEMHDRLYEELATWNEFTPGDFRIWLEKVALELEMDVDKFLTDLERDDIVNKVKKAWDDGSSIGLPGTPFLLINGQIYGGPADYSSLEQIASLLALGKRQFSSCPPSTIDPTKQYIATLLTERGTIVMQLYPEKAPIAVNSFVHLARNGWFDNTTFHRVIPGFVAQTGDPSGTGVGGPGYIFNNEVVPSLRFDRPGVVGMANSGPNTNGSQFFITYGPAPHLDGKYTIFGQVISGLDVLDKITPRDPQPGLTLTQGDKLISVTVEEK